LREDLRNTIANTYYNWGCAVVESEISQTTGRLPKSVFLEKNVFDGTIRMLKERGLLHSAVENLPGIVASLRELARDGKHETCDLGIQVLLDVFKYQIPDAPTKSPIRLFFERPFYARKVTEIPNLWRLFP
jgi:hypothetical protein